MFDDLISFEPEPGVVDDFVPLKKANSRKSVNALANTAQWLEELGVPSDEDIDTRVQTQAARNAFEALNYSADTPAQVNALAAIKTPAAVQHLVGMLTAYDWEFIGQAKELRGYAVAKILEETKHPDAKIRLKALQMLGNVTEIALFTERVEVTKKDASEEEIEKRLRERLSKFITPEEGAQIKEVTVDDEVVQVAENRNA
jgi:HEAT repeat protein